jgi:hypothetical protein
MKKLLVSGIFALTLVACGGDSSDPTPPVPTGPYQPSMVVSWNATALDVIRNGALGPPAVARALGMTHTAMFDAWAAYDAKAVAVSAGAPAKRPASEATEAAKSAAVSVAAYRVLLNLYPTQKDRLDAALKAQNLAPDNTAQDGTPAGVGNLAAAALIAARANDGSNQSNAYADTSGYQPANSATEMKDVNYWQPQTFCNGRAPGFLLPHWGTVKPFALASGSTLRPLQGPAKMGEPKFMQQAQDVIAISAGLTEQQKVIAEYWADGPASETPPGHWYLFAQNASKTYRYDLDQDVKLYMAIGNAMLDTSIATWDTKRAYDSVRPISAIRTLFKDQTIQAWVSGKGTQSISGKDWSPYQPCTFVTPPFAEFTSGHSAFSAAAAEILKRFTGSDATNYSATITPGTMKIEANIPTSTITLNWGSYTAAADEAGLSRRYGGIHFEDGDLVGRTLGRNVADVVWKKAQTHFGN